MGLKEDYEHQMLELYQKSAGTKEDGMISGLICPTYYKEKCGLCTMCMEILFDRSNEGTPIQEKARDVNMKKTYYSNIIFPANPNDIVVFAYGDKIFKRLLRMQMDPQSDYKFFFHPEQGRNMFVDKIPGATKRQTQYDVEARPNTSKLPDRSILVQLGSPEHQLHNIIQLMKEGKVKSFPQSKLPNGKTEIRVLPSWLGPDSIAFFHQVMYHYNITEDEFRAIQEGKLDPFASLRKNYVAKPESKPTANADVGKSPWGTYLIPAGASVVPVKVETEEEKLQTSKKGKKPGCYGEYDAGSTECTEECMEDGWAIPCKEKAIAEEATRKTARRLSR